LFTTYTFHDTTHNGTGVRGVTDRYCNTLQQTATHCNTLQHTATHCNTLPHAATHCRRARSHGPLLLVAACSGGSARPPQLRRRDWPTSYDFLSVCVVFGAGVQTTMGWLRLVGSLKLYVSFAEYCFFYRALLQKRRIVSRSLLIVAPP